MAPDLNTVKDLKIKKDIWHSLSRLWSYVHWVIGILGVVMSTLAAAGEAAGDVAPVYSVIAAICFGIMGFANPQKQSARYIVGYVILEDALLRYNANKLSLDQLFVAYRDAETMVQQDKVSGAGRGSVPPPVTPQP